MASRASPCDEAASCRRRMSLPTAEIPEAGTVIDQIFEHRRIELLLTHQIDQNAWIEITAARAHDHPTGWGQSHARVDRFTAFDRGDAGAIAGWAITRRFGRSFASWCTIDSHERP